MGAGAGATNTVGFRSSLQVAVEDTEEEIRLEISDQEDLHRQLRFLEKGRSLLDFKLGETSSTTVKPIPLVEQILSSQVQGVVGDVAEIRLGLGSSGKFGSTRCSGLDGANYTLSRGRAEGCSIHEGPIKDQASVLSSRYRNICYDNGPPHARATPKVLLDREAASLYAPHKDKQSCLLVNALPDKEGDVIIKRISAGEETSGNLLLAHENSLVIKRQASLYSRKGEEVPTSEKSISPNSHVPQKEYNENNVMSHGSMVLAVKDCEVLHGDKQSKYSFVDSKLQDTIAAVDQSDFLGNACSLNNLNAPNFFSDTMVRKESKKINWIVDAEVSINTNLNTKMPSTFNLSKIHSRRVDIDHEPEECRMVCIEEIPAMAAKNAQEDIILEKAKSVKNFQDQLEKWASRKAMPRPSKEKLHWDFVLEEVAWLANDFMQERLWKISAASRLSQQACCMYNSQFKAVSFDPEPERSSFETVEFPTNHTYGTSDSRESYQGHLDNSDIKLAVPVNVDSSTYKEGELFYVVPEGALQSYRLSVERDWAAIEAEHLTALAKGEAQASLVSDLDLTAFGEETKPLIGQSLARIGFEEEDDSLEIQDVTSSLDSCGPQAAFAKRKRKHILNRPSEINPSVGLYAPNLNPYKIVPSTHASFKRPSGNRDYANCVNMGNIPTKRLRTAAVAARQRASGTAGPILYKLGVTGPNEIITGAVEPQQKALLSLSEFSVPVRNMQAESSPRNSTQGVTSNDICSPVSKRKKNTKFHSISLSSTADGAVHAPYLGKPKSSDHVQQHEICRQVEQKSQFNQKSDQLQQTASNVSSSDAGFGHISETPETLRSQVVADYLLKKVSLSKQLPDEQLDCECTPNQVIITQASPKVSNLTSPHKVFRQTSGREHLKKNKLGKGYFLQTPASQPGIGIPWSTIEDQAILALVHDLGPNWELVSDVLSSSSQVKGIFRKPLDCEARHRALIECLSIDEVDSSEDITTHAQSSSFPRNSKGSIRMLLQRFQGPMEEDTLKVHFERIVHVVQQDRYKKNQIKINSENPHEILPAHMSHLSAISQLSPSSLPGGALTPLDLCDRTSLNGEMHTNAFMAQPPHMSGMGFPGVFPPGAWLRPSSAGLPLLPSLPGGPALPSSSATMNAARDAQWMAASMRTLSAEEQRLRYTRLATGRGLLQDPSSGSTPWTNLSHASDCSLPVLPMTNNGSLIGGLNRSTSLPRVGLQPMLAFGVPGMVPAGINGILPSTGAVVANTSTLSAGSVAGPINLVRRSNDTFQTMRAGQGTEDQRLMLIQELQHHASQGNTHAAAALSSLPSTMISSPKHAFVIQQHQNPHQLQQHSPNEAYFAALQLAKERRLQQEHERQQQHQHQHQKRLLQQQQQLPHNSSFQPQARPSTYYQHTAAQHNLHSQLQLQHHADMTASNATLQEQSAAPLVPPTLQTSWPQLSATTAKQLPSLGSSVQDSSHQVLNQNQLQSHLNFPSQLSSRGVKVPGRGVMAVPSVVSSQPGQPNLFVRESQQNSQLLQQTPNHLQGQREAPAVGSIEPGKQYPAPQHGTPEQPVQMEVQGVNLADNTFTCAQ